MNRKSRKRHPESHLDDVMARVMTVFRNDGFHYHSGNYDILMLDCPLSRWAAGNPALPAFVEVGDCSVDDQSVGVSDLHKALRNPHESASLTGRVSGIDCEWFFRVSNARDFMNVDMVRRDKVAGTVERTELEQLVRPWLVAATELAQAWGAAKVVLDCLDPPEDVVLWPEPAK